jgi:CRISPR system Cascade subunit CasB
MTVAAADPPVRKKWNRAHGELGEHVAGIVATLQARALGDRPVPEAVSALARLRRGVGREPGSDYTLESYLYVPDNLLTFVPKDGPADAEYAVHDAITLYALHQQSQRQPMYARGNGLGTCVSILESKADGGDGIRRRFAALGTATTYSEVIYHLRSLTTLLRGAGIPLDYGLLADDLLTLRRPDGSARVRAAWGREFFRTRTGPEPVATTSTTSETPEENPS